MKFKCYEADKHFDFKGDSFNLCEFEWNESLLFDEELNPDISKIDFELRDMLAHRAHYMAELLSIIRCLKKEPNDKMDKYYHSMLGEIKRIEDTLNDRMSEFVSYDIYHPIKKE